MPRILWVALCFTAAAFAGDADFPLATAVECSPRAGLPNFLAKSKKPGAEVRIAYLGGSITAQPGWRPKTLAYFQKIWPQAKISEINAANYERAQLLPISQATLSSGFTALDARADVFAKTWANRMTTLHKAAILAKNKNTIDKPERFNGTAFYPDAILLVGELAK